MTREPVGDFIKGALIALVIFAFALPFVPGAVTTVKSHYHNTALKTNTSANDGAATQSVDSSTSTSTSTSSNTASSDTSTAATDSSSDYSSTPDYTDYSAYDSSSDYTPSYDYSSPDYSSDYSSSDYSSDYSTPSYDGYTNSDGNYIPSPNYSGSTIGGYSPTYTCDDGSYSYAQHSQGACSSHGGVAY